MNVWSISASITVTIAYILTQFGTEHICHTINTSEWPNSYNLKIQYGGGRHLEFRKIVNNSGLDKKYLHHILCDDASRPCRDDHVTKGRNRKLFRWRHEMNVLSISASISVTITDIWTKFGTDLKFHTVYTPEWSNSQLQNTRCRLPPFWIFRLCEFKKTSVPPDWMKIYASNFTE